MLWLYLCWLLLVIGQIAEEDKRHDAKMGCVRSERHSFCYRCSSRKWRWQPAITQEGGSQRRPGERAEGCSSESLLFKEYIWGREKKKHNSDPYLDFVHFSEMWSP